MKGYQNTKFQDIIQLGKNGTDIPFLTDNLLTKKREATF